MRLRAQAYQQFAERSKSLIMSTADSVPHESRNNPFVMPHAAFSSPLSDACVCVNGCVISDALPPRLSANLINFSDFINSGTFSSSISNDITPPAPVDCEEFTAYPSFSGSPA